MPHRHRHAPAIHPVAELNWTEGLQQWKVLALRDVLRELEHICAGPRSVPKSFCLSEAVHHVVARDFDPESPTGMHLAHILSGAIAQQIRRRTAAHHAMRQTLPAGLPDAFVRSYLNSQWWLDAYLQAEGACCADVTQAIMSAITAAEEEAATAEMAL